MARIRSIKPDFFLNDELAQKGPLAALMFAGLWTQADREGRLKDRPNQLKASILPYYECDADKILEALTDGFIIRYEVDGVRYIQIANFLRHQCPNVKEPQSIIPAQTDEVCQDDTDTVSAQCQHDTSTSLIGGEGKGRERKGGESACAQDAAAFFTKAAQDLRLPPEQPAGNLPACLSSTYGDDVWRSADGVSHETPAMAFWYDVQSARGASLLSPRDRGLFCSAVGDTCPAHCTKTADAVSECLAVLTKAAKKTDGKPTPLFRKICEEDR